MWSWIPRLYLPNKSLSVKRLPYNYTRIRSVSSKSSSDQVEYLNSAIDKNPLDWPSIKAHVLSQPGQINQKNYEGILLKVMVNGNKYDAALSFAKHLRNNSEQMTLGSTNGLLGLYYEIGLTRKLTKEEKMFITESYISLYSRYKILDFSTCERLILALCTIDEWEKSLKVLEDIFFTSVPSHKAFSVLIGALFRTNEKKKALEIISKSIEHKRPLQHVAFSEWISFILRKYKSKDIRLKHLDEIFAHISRNYAVVDEETANLLQETFANLGWDAEFTSIRKMNGQCTKCQQNLNCLKLSEEDFSTLQRNVKQKLIVGSNLFLKSSPEELKRFLSYIEDTGPYDVVIDALNVAYAVGNGSSAERASFLLAVVEHFKQRKKKVLLLGRKHMLKWGRGSIERLKNGICSFFTEDISQDDPYFITAAILSGPNTDIVSKDLLRGHQFVLHEESLRYIFKKWQWQHQWMVFITGNKGFKVQPPLLFTPCAQKSNGGWHLPYQSDATKVMGQINDGTPDLSKWLCLRPKNK